MKNKRNKLQIKVNWSKALTISDKEMRVLKGGLESLESDCMACQGCQPQVDQTLNEEPDTN